MNFLSYLKENEDNIEKISLEIQKGDFLRLKSGKEQEKDFIFIENEKPGELYLIRLFIDDYQEIRDFELIKETEHKIIIEGQLKNWSLEYEAEKLCFYRGKEKQNRNRFILSYRVAEATLLFFINL